MENTQKTWFTAAFSRTLLCACVLGGVARQVTQKARGRTWGYKEG